MNRRQKIIVSITGIFIVLLALVGLTYGYFLTQIQYNDNPTSISIETANLRLEYGNGESGNITALNILPNTVVDEKDFTVTNTGDGKVNNYKVYLENVTNSFERKEDIVYTLTCTSSDEENSPCTNQITSETVFPSNNTVLLTNSIDAGDVQTYRLNIKYKEANTNQSIDMGKQLIAKVNIYDEKTVFLIDKFLSNGVTVDNVTYSATEYAVISAGNNFKITQIKDEIDYSVSTEIFNKTLTESNVGLFFALDDYGTSIFLRGPVSDNYVTFANKLWRIVRINGDSSIRMILNDSIMESTYLNNENGSNSYVGYMYGMPLSENYDLIHENNNDSTAKGVIDNWYNTNIESKGFSSYVSDTLFCNDKTISSGTGLDDGTETLYSAYQRIFNDNPAPTLECAKGSGEYNYYSRFTSEATTTSRGVTVNSALTYPVALLTVDELVMAGVKLNCGSWIGLPYTNYNTALNSLLTMTPKVYNSTNGASVFAFGGGFTDYTYNGDIRPVLSLKPNVLFKSGTGTSTDPYVVTLARS